MLRAIREFWNPSLKCKRLGHTSKPTTVKIRKKSHGRVVVKDYKAMLNICDRCGKKHGEPFNLKQIDWFTSCSMPSRMWEEIKSNGYLILD